jgi:DNA-binding MarR family transcriptional regulator
LVIVAIDNYQIQLIRTVRIATHDNLAEIVFDALDVAAKAHGLLPELPEGVRPLHFRALYAFYRVRDGNGTARVSDINRQLGFKLPNTTRLINDLAERGVVEKAASDADRRVVLVRATRLGESYIRKYVVTYDTDLQREFASISEKDCRVMVATIDAVYHAIENAYSKSLRDKGKRGS